jgi:CDP-2,3-bis-(O-geranylgeranyl)-sn-glycerol synthase
MNYLSIFYLLFPAFAANMMPQIASSLGIFPKLNYPVDHYKQLFGKRIFGDNKTYRGFVTGVGVAIIISLIQFILDKYGLIKVTELAGFGQFLFFGFLSGFGALAGDTVESFFKRRLDIKNGRPLIPFDQIDYLAGFLVFTSQIINWTWPEIIFILICGAILNPLVNISAYFLKIKKTYW